MKRRLLELGIPLGQGGVEPPRTLRIRSLSKTWSPKAFSEFVQPEILKALPAGVTLQRARALRQVVLPPAAELSRVRLSRFAKRAGPLTTTAIVEFTHEEQIVARVPVTVNLLMDKSAARPFLAKGCTSSANNPHKSCPRYGASGSDVRWRPQ